jgi:hypothetical protein
MSRYNLLNCISALWMLWGERPGRSPLNAILGGRENQMACKLASLSGF